MSSNQPAAGVEIPAIVPEMGAPHREPGLRELLRETFSRRLFAYLGPGFLVSVGYMDPGNWGTDIEAGSRFGYRLLWVLFASNLMAIFLQSLSAKLGLITGRTLAENCREHFSRRLSLFLWIMAEIAMMATDLAEFLGAALGFYILFHIPMLAAGLLTGGVVFIILAFSRYGYRKVEYIIISMVSIIGLCYLVELGLARPDWGGLAKHVVIPWVDSASILVAVGMLGATVMPHNLFLHSGIIQTRALPGNNAHNTRVFRFAVVDAIFSLMLAWLVNSAILIMSAAAFHRGGLVVTSITEAHQTLAPLLGPASSFAFAIALLCSGLSSSTTGTMAGQIVIEGFLKIRFSIWLRRFLTMIPAMIVIALGLNEIKILVVSQACLSLQLPFAIIPLLLFTRRKDLLGQHANLPVTNIIAWIITAAIVLLNMLLLYQVFGGRF